MWIFCFLWLMLVFTRVGSSKIKNSIPGLASIPLIIFPLIVPFRRKFKAQNIICKNKTLFRQANHGKVSCIVSFLPW
jgi:hypothetical protein